MKKLIPLLLILTSCHPIPKKGEIWRNAVPYTMDVQVDSVVDNQLVMYSWDSAHMDTSSRDTLRRIGWPGNAVYIPDEFVHETGVCSIDSFTVRGFKVGEVNGSGFTNPMTTKGILDSGLANPMKDERIDSFGPGVNDTSPIRALMRRIKSLPPYKASDSIILD